ncbi:uncharacterized protein [Dysidea avara]|uniref:uncharacterized protein isoform X2 n=1 Tax=Dysidea avara TaxID=196820 RepID=UPI003332BC89
MKRNFVYTTTTTTPAVNARQQTSSSSQPPLKKHKPFEETDDLLDDDELLDAIGTQALEQFENNNDCRQSSNATASSPKFPLPTSSNMPVNSAHCSSFSQATHTGLSHQTSNVTAVDAQLETAVKQNRLLEQKVKLLQEEQYSQVGEVKILREKLNQAEVQFHAKETSIQQMRNQMQSKWEEKEKELQEKITSLTSMLEFKEQETLDAHEKCKYLEQQQKVASKNETSPLVEEVRVQSDIKMTPVSARCKEAKQAQKNLKNFGTEFPVSDPLNGFSMDSGSCSKSKSKPRVTQLKYSKAVNTSTPITAHPNTSTPITAHPTTVALCNQETQTPVGVLQYRNQNDIMSVELDVPLLDTTGHQLFNHLMGIYPKIEKRTTVVHAGCVFNNESTETGNTKTADTGKSPASVLSLICPVTCVSNSAWLEQNFSSEMIPKAPSICTSLPHKTVSMDEQEDKSTYLLSRELPASGTSTPFLRDPVVQCDIQQSLASLLGSAHLPDIPVTQKWISDLNSFSITNGDSGIKLLLVLEKLVERYYTERTQEGSHCKSVESWVSGSLEGLLPSFTSSDEDRIGQRFKDPMRMDNAQAIIHIMDIMLELVRRSKTVRCHILDHFLSCPEFPSKPPLLLDGSKLSNKDDKWPMAMEVNSGPYSMEQMENGPMDCDQGSKLESSANSVSSILDLVPLGDKLGPHRQNTWLVTEGAASLSKAVLVSANRDTSTLSSVVGSYGDHTFSSGANYFPQNTAPGGDSCVQPNNLFTTLLRLMEPLHQPFEEEAVVTSNALEILVVLAQDCSEHQLECYQESSLSPILRPILRRGCTRMRLLVVNLLYQLASSPAVINSICTNGDHCPLLYAYELLSNCSSKCLSDSDLEYGLKILQMVARAMSTGHEEGGKPMYIFDFDCCCSGELITGLLAFTKRMVKACTADSEKLMDDGNSIYEIISQVILVLLPVILNPEIGDDITHRDDYKHNYTEVVKGLSMVLLQCAPSSKWEQAVSTLKELLDYDDLQECLNATSNSSTAKTSLLHDL